MSFSLYFLILSVGVVVGSLLFKFLMNKEDIYLVEEEMESGTGSKKDDQLIVAKDLFFLLLDDAKFFLERNVKIFFHWVLHIFVIFLGLISDITDIVYFRARDFFLKTATREKDVVSAFWHHLKEYKKEKEEEDKS